jgi:hypothetical protein
VSFDPETAIAARFKEIMQQVTLVPYDGEAARRAVGIQRQLRQQGDRIGAVDVMIAGVALARDVLRCFTERQRVRSNAGTGVAVLISPGYSGHMAKCPSFTPDRTGWSRS